LESELIMTQFVDESSEASSPRGNLLLLIGSVIGLVSAMGLAWEGRANGDLLYDVLTGRDPSGTVITGQRLVRIGWCPLGVALGGTFVWFGLRRAARQSGLSLACMALVAVYGLLALVGAFSVFHATGNLRASFLVVATSETGIKPEQLALATTEAAVGQSRGWMLFAAAHVALLAGGIAQIVRRPRSKSSAQWPSTAIVALILLWVFGAIVSTGWIRYGWAFQQSGAGPVVKAALVAEQISGVLGSGRAGSLLLMGHALSTIVLAGIAAFAASQRSSSRLAHEGH
jgi:hypothetical protein